MPIGPINRFLLCLVLGCLCLATAQAHPGGHGIRPESELRQWTNRITGERIYASMLFADQGKAHLERAGGEGVVVPLNELTAPDRQYVEARSERIRQRNNRFPAGSSASSLSDRTRFPSSLPFVLTVMIVGAGAAYLFSRMAVWQRVRVAVILCLLALLFSGYAVQRQAQTNRPAAAAPFDFHAPKVRTRWDAKYLYVESDGIPDHQMMVGIRAWQQQVPLPQPYYSENAWSIPLNPALATQPISARTALFTGAIALAANGIPIFNALNNRGVDSFSIGELDEFGGHCGRADDYHYHAAPLHILAKVGPSLPIGYALDGFPLYGLNEPDGAPATGLDEFNGHFDNAGKYHYHSTKTYPYINGGMRGVVTVSNDQIVPQPRAYSVRPFTSPLNGATITGFAKLGPNSWSLEYRLNNQLYKVNYSIDSAGRYNFEFIDPSGAKRTESYTRRGLIGGVSAASYGGLAVATESIVSIFGAGMATAARSADITPLPTDLGGSRLRVIDSLGVPRFAPLFFVSPTQINCQIPPGTSNGTASLSISLNGAFAGFGDLNVSNVAPGVFTADASGQGYPAAQVYRYRNNSLIAVDPVARFDPGQNKVVAVPIDLSSATDALFLTLFGTGMRYRSGLNGVTATIGGVAAEVLFAGAQGDYVGLDQINLRLPDALKNRAGDVDVVLIVDGLAANTVRINLVSPTQSISNLNRQGTSRKPASWE